MASFYSFYFLYKKETDKLSVKAESLKTSILKEILSVYLFVQRRFMNNDKKMLLKQNDL